jgi:hypothetical protein
VYAAGVGSAPKLEYFKSDASQISIGSQVYNDTDKAVLETKLSSVSNKWDTMFSKVTAAIDKGA